MVLDLAPLRSDLTAIAEPGQAEPMAAYMKHRFAFLGVKTPARRRASRSVFAAARTATTDEVLAFAAGCWAEPEREFQYVGADVLGREAKRLGPAHLGRVEVLITTRSWWDSVDALASQVVGTMVLRHRELAAVMDDWIDASDVWLARTAILHQLRWKADTDADRLFAYAARRAGDHEFFVRKAIGWALREFAKTDADAVRAFVADQGEALSGLTRREALRNL